MSNLYDLLAERAPEMNEPDATTPPPTPGTIYTASIETIDNDHAGVLLGALNI